VLLPARTKTQRSLLERCLRSPGVVQVQLADPYEPTELFPGEDPEHRVVTRHLRQVEVGAVQQQPGLPLLAEQCMRFGREG
jgi:hypothetical protein